MLLMYAHVAKMCASVLPSQSLVPAEKIWDVLQRNTFGLLRIEMSPTLLDHIAWVTSGLWSPTLNAEEFNNTSKHFRRPSPWCIRSQRLRSLISTWCDNFHISQNPIFSFSHMSIWPCACNRELWIHKLDDCVDLSHANTNVFGKEIAHAKGSFHKILPMTKWRWG